ncbi:sigma-54-dependent transcriptional regulator [Blastopirellula retiformator]|uniref:DNA-binding transcriptional regulator NtrC n=1 Tax=Blastopirellula retiformator TaxID=2527970 RepID=A0A5C5V7D2_9BACT|nr:sigma-54 dependent transcriptional regulator [Blastopirellula retiformator]TWT34478.1 Nitrogen assimilation regulatory protein [Blastopirellula retiformator]
MRRPMRMLVIDDDPGVALIVQEALGSFAMEFHSADCGATGLQLLEKRRPDVVLLDQMLPDCTGVELIKKIQSIDSRLPILFVTSRKSSDLAIEAMKLGTFDFLTKPFAPETIAEKVLEAIESRHLMLMPVQLPSQNEPSDVGDRLVGACPAMQTVYKSIGRAAAHDIPVLLQGENGTGKELVARAIYQHGQRGDRPFHKISCTDFTAQWLESELLGHEPCAMPGLMTQRIGKFEQCNGGTILLEEIAAIPHALQSKLLRYLSEKRFERLGGDETLHSDVTLFFTTSYDAEELVAEGRLRPDLYYLLSGFLIKLPPLREREDDLRLLVDHFVSQFSRVERISNMGAVRTSDDSLRLLADYSWPGNVSELRSVLRRAMIESQGAVIASEYLRRVLRESGADRRHGEALDTNWERFVDERISSKSNDIYSEAVIEMERHLISLILRQTGGNQAHAARLLGITRTSLRKKINYLGLEIEQFLATA